MGVIDLEARRAQRSEDEPHVSVPAVCLGCKHEWMAVIPEGFYHDLDCPKCEMQRGALQYNIEPEDGENIFTCNACNNSAFWVTKTGVLCMGCGTRTSYQKLAEAE